MAGDVLQVEASITNARAAVCERCSAVLLGEQKPLFVRSATTGNRRVCGDCFKHYQVKSSSKRVEYSGEPTGDASAQTVKIGTSIKENVNRAQRGEFEGHKVVKAISGRKPATMPLQVPTAVKILFPEHLRFRINGALGYSDAHEVYKECQKFYHERAMVAGNTELVTLQATMCHVSGTQFKAIGDVMTVISNVNVHVGCHDLHSILYAFLLPRWLKYSRNVKLLLTDTSLANDNHAEILPRIPDINAIKDKCYVSKGVKKVQSLITRPLKLYLHIESTKVQEAEFRRIEYSEQDAPEINVTVVYTASKRSTSTSKRKRRTVSTSSAMLSGSDLDSDDSDSAAGVRKKKKVAVIEESALEVECTHGRSPATVTHPVAIPDPPFSFDSIRLALSQQSIVPKRSLNTAEVILGTSTNVCLKRCFIRSSDGSISMLPEDRQYNELSRELNCIVWAKVLLDMVYQFIARKDEACSTRPSFTIPQLRFIDAALVVARRNNHEELYMMEERIGGSGPDSDRNFMKYICNNSGRPILLRGSSLHASERNQCARFLSFAQHVQYLRTAKLAFTSDFQGAGNLLTDPQIITSPDLGDQLFARGNVAFEKMLETHECTGNEFCQYYKLSRHNFGSA
ncbi:hypothetical protein J3R30DRAFT_3708305 [Lentinula aciculospora]|uniref:Alpha-type protein kinase domain-containing protein n=1 Tax=Lentinula aciculospora TaxID=153920 RepID=A0A9W9A464_9AGAR|nr:hypothetical protein J3R30DRAFT_3708305 [Lentinula aciculospora]